MARSGRRNRQLMYYSIPDGTTPLYETDSDGNIIYEFYEGENGEKIYYLDDEGNKIPRDTGEIVTHYSEEVPFNGSLSSQLENAIMRAWGSDNSKNYATLVLAKTATDFNGNQIELTNGTRIWRKSTVKYMPDGSPDGGSADYVVSGVLDEELNETSYYLTKLDGGTDE